MKPLNVTLVMLCMLLAPASALAGEALPELKGSWVAETLDGKPPQPGMKMVMTFIDDSKLQLEATFQGETRKEEVKYSATKDGTIIIYPDPDTNPDGEKATWQIKDKKLHIKTSDGESLVFARPS